MLLVRFFYIICNCDQPMIKVFSAIGRAHRNMFLSSLAAAAYSFQNRTVSAMGQKKYDDIYDLAVIGGGSGGLSTAF